MALAGIGTGVGSSVFLAAKAHAAAASATGRPHGVGGVGGDSVSLSAPGQFLSQLQALQASDPQKFKEVLSQTALQLQSAARLEGDTPRGRSLSDLAAKVQSVAASGDLSQLKPATYANRVQQAYGAPRADPVQELMNTLSAGAASVTGTDPRYVLKSAFSALGKV